MRKMLELLRDFIRPLSVLWLLLMLLLGAVISGVLEAVWPGMGANFTKGVASFFIAIPEEYYELTKVGLVSYVAARQIGDVASKKYAAKQKAEGAEIGPDAAD